MAEPIAAYIDHTLLKPEATASQIDALCLEARQHHFASVCIHPTHVVRAAAALRGSSVQVCTVIGFPLGQNTTAVKVAETVNALQNGANEIDMVINLSWVKDKLDGQIAEEIQAIKRACGTKILKVILETCLLNDEEKVRACRCAVKGGADFVKTSTGFSTGGATVADVALMRKTVGPKIGVKASGGIRSLEDMKAMIAAGATRIGTSSGVKILSGTTSESKY